MTPRKEKALKAVLQCRTRREAAAAAGIRMAELRERLAHLCENRDRQVRRQFRELFGWHSGDCAVEEFSHGKEIGGRIRAAGVASPRRTGDPDTLETYQVPGKEATAWLFWNGDEKRTVTVERDGHRLTIGAERGGYLQISDDGRAEVATEL